MKNYKDLYNSLREQLKKMHHDMDALCDEISQELYIKFSFLMGADIKTEGRIGKIEGIDVMMHTMGCRITLAVNFLAAAKFSSLDALGVSSENKKLAARLQKGKITAHQYIEQCADDDEGYVCADHVIIDADIDTAFQMVDATSIKIKNEGSNFQFMMA